MQSTVTRTATRPVTRAPQHAITDVYDEQRHTFLVQYPVAVVVALGLVGVAVFALIGFLGFRDELEPALTRTILHQPWPLFLWFCALIMTLQISILRHPSLRRQLTGTLIVTTLAIIIVGAAYYYNAQIQAHLEQLLQYLLGRHILLQLLGNNPWTYAFLNFLILAIFWIDTIRRWSRRARGLAPTHRVDLGIFISGDDVDPDDMASLQELVSGDLIAGAVLAVLLSLIFRAPVLNFFSDTLNVGVHISTCTVSWPVGVCVGGGGLHQPPTLSFIDVIQSLIYLPLGLLILALSATLSGLAAAGGVDERALAQNPLELAALQKAEAAGDSNTESVSEQVSLTVLNTLRSALNRRLRLAAGNLGYSLRNAAWPVLILVGIIGVAACARYIQQYLHLLSDQRTCTTVACPDYHVVQGLLAQDAQYQAVFLALLWGIVAVLGIVLSAALLIYSRRVAVNTLRFLGLIGFVLLLTFWIFSLALSALNGLLSLTNISPRVPFPQPGAVTVLSLVALLVYAVFAGWRRLRTPTVPVTPVAQRSAGAGAEKQP